MPGKDYAFVVYNPHEASPKESPAPSVSLQSTGHLRINVSADRLLDSPDAVELLWDEATASVGIRATERGLPTALPVRRQQRATMVNAEGFCKRYGISYEQTRYFPIRMAGNILTFQVPSEAIIPAAPDVTLAPAGVISGDDADGYLEKYMTLLRDLRPDQPLVYEIKDLDSVNNVARRLRTAAQKLGIVVTVKRLGRAGLLVTLRQ